MQLHILTAKDINQALSMQEAIEVMRMAFLSLAQQKVVMPDRSIINLNSPITTQQEERIAAFMPAYLIDSSSLGIKIGGLSTDNPPRGLPLIHTIVVLLDAVTGIPQVLLEGAAITALKTGATSGLVTDILAPKEIKTLAIIGAGVQARAQLKAMCCIRKIQQVKIYSRTYKKAEQFATEILQKSNLPFKVVACSTLREATQDAEVICTATTSKVPIIDVADIRLGVHINAIGGHTLTTREVSALLIAAAKVIVEQRAATFRESCERDVIEIGEILAKKEDTSNWQSPTTIFASVGIALQDIALATAAWNLAKKKNLGTYINL